MREERAAKWNPTPNPDPNSAPTPKQERAAKWGTTPTNPLESIVSAQAQGAKALDGEPHLARGSPTYPYTPTPNQVSAQGAKAFWEKRRDTAEDEVPRPEAVHIFGVDKLSTEVGSNPNPDPHPHPTPTPNPPPLPRTSSASGWRRACRCRPTLSGSTTRQPTSSSPPPRTRPPPSPPAPCHSPRGRRQSTR